jgi:hypothetical protein
MEITMNWDAIGAIGEVIGATAVVLSLIYLATQVRVSNRLARAEAWRTPNSDLNSLNASFAANPIFRTAFYKVTAENAIRSEMENDEAIVLDMYFISVLNIYEQIFREIREGILKNEAIKDFGAQSMLRYNYFRSSWQFYRGALGHSFAVYFEERFNLGAEDSAA